jgi:cytochrome c oxidase subunit 3
LSTEPLTTHQEPRAGDPPVQSAGAGHPAHLAHHFCDMNQQHEANTLGMWMFLATEIMFFGGVLTAYTVYRWKYPDGFAAGSEHLYTSIGTVNTVVLLCSSLTMALAVRAARINLGRRTLQIFMAATMALGLAFLVIKGFEYYLDYREHLIPRYDFHPDKWPAGLDLIDAQIFFTFYFVLTAIHGLHMLAGLGVMTVMFILAGRGRFHADNFTPVEVMGLYWHFVDIVWVFLFPLLYLIR